MSQAFNKQDRFTAEPESDRMQGTFFQEPSVSAAPGRRTRFRWYVLGLVFILNMLASADRANIGIVLRQLSSEFHLSNTEAGAIVGLVFMAYGAMQVPSAFLIRWLGASRVLPWAMIATSLFTALHGFVNSTLLLKFCRVGLGICEGPIGLSCLTTINNWFPRKEKGLAAGVFTSAAKLGPVIVPPLGAIIVLHLGWHYVFLLFAIPGLLIPFVWMATVTDRPSQSRFVSEAEATLIESDSSTQQSTRENGAANRFQRWIDLAIRARLVAQQSTVKGVLCSWTVWGVSACFMFQVGTINTILAWLPTYLQTVKGFAIVSTGFLAAAPFVGGMFGTLAGGLISDRLFGGRRKPLMLFSCAGTAVMMFALRSSPDNVLALASLLFVTGTFFSLGFSSYTVYFSTFADRRTFPVAVGILNTLGQIGGGAIPFLTGAILDHSGWNLVFACLTAVSVTTFALLMTVIEPMPSTLRRDSRLFDVDKSKP